MQKFFTADYHLGHGNIIKYCNRPFKDLEHMESEIIRRHNERVKPEDLVFHIGDFCFKNSKGGKPGEGVQHNAEYYMQRLNGRFVHIKGNHDRNNSLKTIIERVVIKYGHYKVLLTHDPRNVHGGFKINFVGHVHDSWKFKELRNNVYMINVGVDIWRFRPVKFEELMREFHRWVKYNKPRGDYGARKRNYQQQREEVYRRELGTSKKIHQKENKNP